MLAEAKDKKLFTAPDKARRFLQKNPAEVKKLTAYWANAKGVQNSFFGYYSGATPTLGADGKYQVLLDRVRFNKPVGGDGLV